MRLIHDTRLQAPVGLARARVELLAYSRPLRGAIEATLKAGGWACDLIDERDLERVDRENWNLIVIGGERVVPRMLTASARAARNPRTRVLAVAPSRDPQEIADVLRAGADDFVAFPYEPLELCARARSLIAFSYSLPARRRFGALGFDFSARTVFDGPARVTLSPGEWDVLIALLNADGEAIPTSVISHAVEEAAPVAVASTVSRLRRKLRAGGITAIEIDTVGGRGYAMHIRRQRSG